MAPYELRVSSAADRTLARLPEAAAAAIVEFLTGALTANPRRVGKPLARDLAGWHAARRGAYRVIYVIDEDTHSLRVDRIDHRADVYRSR